MASASNSTTLYSIAYGTSSSYNYTLAVSFNENSTSVANNTSNITINASLTPHNMRWSSSSNSTLAIYWHDNRTNADTYVSQVDITGISTYTTVTSVSGTINVTHKDDGTLSGYAKAAWIKNASSGNYAPNSGNISTANTALTKIARYPVFTTQPTVSKVNETSIKLTRGATSISSVFYYRYKKDGGSYSSWTSMSSSSVTITGLTANTKYICQVQARNSSSTSLTTNSNEVNTTTYDYPKASSINDFVIENGAIVNLYNPLKRNVTLTIISNNDNSIIGTYTGTSEGNVNAEFNTEDAIRKQYASLGNNLAGSTYYVKVECSETSSTKTSGNAKYSVSTTEDRPEISEISYKDVNENTLALTNNENSILRGYSTLRITPSLNKVASIYDSNATFSHYIYSGVEFEDYADILAISNSSVNVTAVNSRGINSTAYVRDIQYHAWFLPIIGNAEIKRNAQVGSKMLVSISGQSYNGYFDIDNKQNKNQLIIKYYAKKNEEDEYTYGGTISQDAITYNEEDNTFYCYDCEIFNPFSEEGLDSGEWSHLQLYYIKLEVNDILTQNRTDTNYVQYINIGVPYFEWWRENDTNFFNVKGEILKNNEPLGEILNENSSSNKDTYSCDFLNNKFNQYFVYYPTRVTTSLASGGWRNMATALTTDVLPAGQYLIFSSCHLYGSVNSVGLATTRIMVDGVEETYGRESIPIMSGYLTSSSAMATKIFTTSTTHTINIQIYGSQNMTVPDNVKLVFLRVK